MNEQKLEFREMSIRLPSFLPSEKISFKDFIGKPIFKVGPHGEVLTREVLALQPPNAIIFFLKGT